MFWGKWLIYVNAVNKKMIKLVHNGYLIKTDITVSYVTFSKFH